MGNDHPSSTETPYAESKLATDHIALLYFNTYDFIIPFNQYGPHQNAHKFSALILILIKKMVNNEEIYISGDELKTRDLIFVKDTFYATIDILKNPKASGKIIHIGSGKEKIILSIAKNLAFLIDYKNEFRFIKNRIGDIKRHCAKVTEAKKLLR